MRKLLIALVLCLALLIPNGMAFAKDIDCGQPVTSLKTWTIKFNHPINPQSINNTNIYMTDSSNKTIDTLEFSMLNASSVQIKNTVPYDAGEYCLHITNSVTSQNGKPLTEAINITFCVTDISFVDLPVKA